jgi:hypothetical protein
MTYFHSALAVTAIGLVLAFGIGYAYTGSWTGAAASLFLTAVLAVLEISLSFDNAVVNASVLKEMTPRWRHRFITWGMLIAVFGMRVVFPLAIVSLSARVDPWSALVLATMHPEDYARIMHEAHVPLAGFGGAFLLMVALNYFFDHEKTEHWIGPLERILGRIGRVHAVEIGICLLFYYALTCFIPDPPTQLSFLASGIFGIVTYIMVDGVSEILNMPRADRLHVERASAAMFVYLEVLDASFSFDGVVGAFALSSNIFIIAVGLGIGAMFVRSLTILLVERETLSHYRFLEQGAFYAIGALATLMIVDVFWPVPEVATGLIGAVIIGISVWSSRVGVTADADAES